MSKFLDMMREQERSWMHGVECWSQADSTDEQIMKHAKNSAATCERYAADWQAMREAWEGLMEAATNIERGAIITPQGDYVIRCGDLLGLEAALTKARGE